MKVENTNFYKILKERKSEFLSNIDKVIKYSEDFLPLMNLVFSNYTNHGTIHSHNILQYMYYLTNNPNELNDFDITMLIYVALLHDIGMVVENNEIEEIKKGKVFLNKNYQKVLERVKDKQLTLQEIIRPIHASRSKQHILNMSDDFFFIPNTDISFKNEISNICLSHNQSIEWIIDERNIKTIINKGNYKSSPLFVSLLLRISDYLDIDASRTPKSLYKYLSMTEYGDSEWKMNLSIENTSDNKVKTNKFGYKTIELDGVAKSSYVYRKLLKYIEGIEKELENGVAYSKKLENKYNLNLITRVENNIETKDFDPLNFKLDLSYAAITNLLMGEKIYGNKQYGLRELIQNSIDACELMNVIKNNQEKTIYDEYIPKIKIVITMDEIIIQDNGTGMSMDIVKNNFLNVGVSYYNSNSFIDLDYNYNPISNYGIGFISSFMLSDKIKVLTKRYDETETIKMLIEKSSEHITISTENQNQFLHGTQIHLNSRDFFKVFKNIDDVTKFIKQNFINTTTKVEIFDMTKDDNNLIEIDLSPLEKETNYYDISDYLIDIEAKVQMTFTNNFLIKELNSISENDFYIYDNENPSELLKIDKKVINDYIEDGMIKYAKFYIIDSYQESEFKFLLDHLEDFKDTLDRFGLEEINVLYKESDYVNYNEVDETDYLINDYSVDAFCTQFGHSNNLNTYVEEEKVHVISLKENKHMIYNINDKDRHYISSFFSGSKEDIYVRNVYIKNNNVVLPYVVKSLSIKYVHTNIHNEEIYPELSRNEINKELMFEINKAIGKAAHLYLYDIYKEELKEHEEKLLLKFISEKYGNCRFVKKQYNVQVK